VPTPRQKKDDHLIYADAVHSFDKSGVWFAESDAFKAQQTTVMEAIKEATDWVPVTDAIMAVSLEPPGIAIIAPNPSLPGIIVLTDGSTLANTEQLKDRYIEIVRKASTQSGVLIET